MSSGCKVESVCLKVEAVNTHRERPAVRHSLSHTHSFVDPWDSCHHIIIITWLVEVGWAHWWMFPWRNLSVLHVIWVHIRLNWKLHLSVLIIAFPPTHSSVWHHFLCLLQTECRCVTAVRRGFVNSAKSSMIFVPLTFCSCSYWCIMHSVSCVNAFFYNVANYFEVIHIVVCDSCAWN